MRKRCIAHKPNTGSLVLWREKDLLLTNSLSFDYGLDITGLKTTYRYRNGIIVFWFICLGLSVML